MSKPVHGTLAVSLVAVVLVPGCISDTDCGICDPNNLVLESISGINYANRKVHLLSPGVSAGKYFIEDIGACIETEDALEAERGPDEWCKLSPLVTWQGLEFVFNNLLDPTSIELVRKNPSNPKLFQIYDWKTQIAHVEGPITRFNGDYVEQPGNYPDIITRSVNLSCIHNLREQLNQDFNHEVLDQDPEICNGFYDGPEGKLPLKMELEGTTKAYRGATSWQVAGCTAPDSGPDTCCTPCDYELSINVTKYGLDGAGAPRMPDNALPCTAGGNVYEDCAEFITDINREDEPTRYTYEWNGVVDTFRLPLYDKVRETHPAARPDGVEPDGFPCQTDVDCTDRLGEDPGAACIGVTDMGVSCNADTPGCLDKHCKAEWFVGCRDDPNLGGAFCVDRRFKDKGAGACFVTTREFVSCESDGGCTDFVAGHRLAKCDTGEYPDAELDAVECCQTTLGAEQDGAGCDPLFQPELVPLARFDRDQTLPEDIRSCYCGDPSGQHEACAAQIERLCTPPWGELERHDGTSNEGDYVTRFVTKSGGVIYDPALKGVLYLPGDTGNIGRARVEGCAAGATNPDLIGGRNIQDGWLRPGGENPENFDRGMCSGSEYRVVFATEGEVVRDKVGNRLGDDETTYVFHTPEFHVVPGSGFPTDNLRVGGCDEFEIDVSNKYDLDPQNLRKISLWQVKRVAGKDALGQPCETSLEPECWEDDFIVAGGQNCTEDPEQLSADTPPCLVVDITGQATGHILVSVDTVRFGNQLFNHENNPDDNIDGLGRELSGRYRMDIPGLEHVERFADLDLGDPDDLAAYDAAFHDVCGMPLVTAGGRGYTDFYFDFTIDEPNCKEDPDRDDVQLSCDNAPEHYNPLQLDQDVDGFGDVQDLCKLTASHSNTADSDKDGVGNDCDSCRQTVNMYNLEMAMVDDPRMWVRNIPMQSDFDHDGIGDVCDNCVTVANCGLFDSSNPHTVGVPVPFELGGVCQTDTDKDMIGDACVDPDTMVPFDDLDNAAGPIGFDLLDDFDQDGIVNSEDWCPRQPLTPDYGSRIECTDDADCGENQTCAPTPANNDLRYCNHADYDGDFVGDVCDTCPYTANPMQVTDAGMQLDDEDGDFVGAVCETNSSCNVRKDPRRYAFMEVAVDGQCCTTTYPGDGYYVQDEDGSWGCEGLCDPDGFPIMRDCADEGVPGEDQPDGNKCRQLPGAVVALPGVVELPPGCQEALDLAGLCAPSPANDFSCSDVAPDQQNRSLTLLDVDGDDDLLWGKMCFFAQWDQDFDGVGDACDLCKFQFDPFNEPYVDENTGKLWDNIGRFCAGEYSPNAVCAADDEDEGGTGTGGDETTG